MFPRAVLLALSVASVVLAQQVGTNTAESHPKLQVSTVSCVCQHHSCEFSRGCCNRGVQCTKGGTCTTSQHSVVLDANWRWLHSTSGYTNCYTGNKWDTSICSDDTSCAQVCGYFCAQIFVPLTQ
jgi:cellulose 1,4-beta-cellobiosidase